jgi:hypothetical protein
MIKQCPRCKTDFEPHHEKQVYCCRKCARNAKRARYVKKYPGCDKRPLSPEKRRRNTGRRINRQLAAGVCGGTDRHPIIRRSDLSKSLGLCKECRAKATVKSHLLDPRRQMIQAARGRASKGGFPFNLKLEDISIPEFCPVFSSIRLQSQAGKGGAAGCSPSLDKIFPELGYVKGNVIVMSSRANTFKSNATLDELIVLGEWARREKETRLKEPVGVFFNYEVASEREREREREM